MGAEEEEMKWGIQVVKKESKESRKSLQELVQAAEEGMLCGI